MGELIDPSVSDIDVERNGKEWRERERERERFSQRAKGLF